MAMTFQQTAAFVDKKLHELLSSPNDGLIKAELANLRRGLGRAPGDLPELWGMLFKELPEEALSRDGAPTSAEWAIYAAMTLFALHQQGHDFRKDVMNQKGQTLGMAVRRLAPAEDDDDMKRVLRRFNAMATSSDMEELTYHMRGIVQLLRAADISLDYPALASDLYRYQIPSLTPSVRLCWGQDFYHVTDNADKNNNGKEDSNVKDN